MLVDVCIVLTLIFFERVFTINNEFIAGVDISHVGFFEDQQIVYRNSDGQSRDLFELLNESGVKWVRLRLFTSSDEQARQNPYDYSPNLKQTLKLARRAKQNQLKILLDFHFSDRWADPGHQEKPKEWANLNFDQLKQRLYDYTRDTMNHFIEQGTTPEFVQIGNEITAGMLWPDGNQSDWNRFGALLRLGIAAVRNVSPQSKILLQITHATNWTNTKQFFDEAIVHQRLDFDIIAQSYYPFFHGALSNVKDCLLHTALTYKKPIILVETGYPWTNRTGSDRLVIEMTGFPTTPNGQADFASALAKMLKQLPGNKGLGLFWWAAEYQPVKAYPNFDQFEYRSFFNTDGYALPILRRFGRLSTTESLPFVKHKFLLVALVIFVGFCLMKIRKRHTVYR